MVVLLKVKTIFVYTIVNSLHLLKLITKNDSHFESIKQLIKPFWTLLTKSLSVQSLYGCHVVFKVADLLYS